MANMSYCRFENTARDLTDCMEALSDDPELEELSESERRYAKRLINICRQIAESYPEDES